MLRGLVVIPAYNEIRAISRVIQRCFAVAPSFDVVVINDCSKDGTAAAALAAGATVVSHPFNLGYGAALQTGYRYAVAKNYDFIVQIDGDGQHDPGEVSKLAEPILKGAADVVVGSRFHPESAYHMPALKRLGSRWFGWLLRLITGLPLSDPTTGFQALSRPVLELYTSDAFPVDYPDADMLVFLHRNGFRIEEVPVIMHDRAESPSMHSGIRVVYYVYKMTLSIIMNAVRPRLREVGS